MSRLWSLTQFTVDSVLVLVLPQMSFWDFIIFSQPVPVFCLVKFYLTKSLGILV